MLRRSSSDTGFTLIEVMIAAAVLAVASLALINAMLAASDLSSSSRERNVAVFAMKSVADEISGLPFDNIMDPNHPPAKPAAPAHPHGFAREYDYLPNMTITVVYLDADGELLPLPDSPTSPWDAHNLGSSFDTPDPLRCRIIAEWTGGKGQTLRDELWTVRTR